MTEITMEKITRGKAFEMLADTATASKVYFKRLDSYRKVFNYKCCFNDSSADAVNLYDVTFYTEGVRD